MEDIECRMEIRGYIILTYDKVQLVKDIGYRVKDTGYRRQDIGYKKNIYDMKIDISYTEIMIKILRKGYIKIQDL